MATRMMSQVEGRRIYEKDTVGVPITDGLIYSGGPWSLVPGEIISQVVPGGSPLMNWLPSAGVVGANEHVKALGYVVPDGFDGSETYMDYLAGLDPIGDCEFGPSTDWNGYEYRHEMYRISFASDTVTRRNFGQRQFEQQPIYRLRGPNAGLSLENDGEWALSRTALQLEAHLNWNIVYGDPTVGQLMYHGIDNVIDNGWVAARAIGPGQVTFADPFVVSAVGTTEPADIARYVRMIVRRTRTRAMSQGYRLQPNDYALVLSSAHWSILADYLACNGIYSCSDTIAMTTTPEVVQRAREALTSGGLGYGSIPVDGIAVPVLIEDLLATNVTLPDGRPGVTGDIYVLVRTFRGMTILENQYLDWSKLTLPAGLQTNEFIRQNGMIRAGWVTEANSCFYYYVDMWGRLISRFQPLQSRLKDVTLASLIDGEIESSSFAHPNFYAFDGAVGGGGTAILFPHGA